MPELSGRRRLHGGTASASGGRVKAVSRASGGAKAPALTRTSDADTLKPRKSILTPKSVAHSTCPNCGKVSHCDREHHKRAEHSQADDHETHPRWPTAFGAFPEPTWIRLFHQMQMSRNPPEPM